MLYVILAFISIIFKLQDYKPVNVIFVILQTVFHVLQLQIVLYAKMDITRAIQLTLMDIFAANVLIPVVYVLQNINQIFSFRVMFVILDLH